MIEYYVHFNSDILCYILWYKSHRPQSARYLPVAPVRPVGPVEPDAPVLPTGPVIPVGAIHIH